MRSPPQVSSVPVTGMANPPAYGIVPVPPTPHTTQAAGLCTSCAQPWKRQGRLPSRGCGWDVDGGQSPAAAEQRASLAERPRPYNASRAAFFATSFVASGTSAAGVGTGVRLGRGLGARVYSVSPPPSSGG